MRIARKCEGELVIIMRMRNANAKCDSKLHSKEWYKRDVQDVGCKLE